MSGLWEDIKNAYFSYNGMGTNVFFLFVAIFYFLIINKKRQRNLLIYEIFGILFLMTPGIANGILNMSGQNTDHWMVYGILNIVAVVGVVMTDYLINIPTKKEKIIVIVIYILLLQAGMGLNYTSQHLEFITNSYKISNEVMEIAEQLEFVEKPRVLAPEQVAGELREYDTRFAVIYGEGLSFTQENLEQLQMETDSYGCNCLVINSEYDNIEFFNSIGFSKIYNTEHFEVYAKYFIEKSGGLMKNLDKTLWIKRIFMVLMDICIVILTSITALIVRFEFSLSAVPKYYIGVVWSSLPATLVIAIIVFYVFRLYSSLWVYAGVTELLYLAAACIVDTLLNTVTILLNYRDQEYPLPRSWYFIYGTLLLAFMFISRYSYRAVRTFFGKKVDEKNLKRVLVVGAGEAGNSIIKEISGSRFVNMHIVGFVDDDKSKIGKYMHGVKVLGDRNDIIEIANEYLVDEIIIAIPTASAKETKAILDICKQTGCELKRLPGMYQLVNGDVSISKLKDVDVNDLLGRDPITVDLDSIMGYVSDKVVMVTGGGGSIGSELCRQIASHNPKQLVIVDIYENTTYDIQQELKRNYPELDLVVLIASVRNTKRMDLIFDKYRPEIVYHAAAHKHVPLMEDSPNEAVKNNVLGTWKVVQAADKYNVKRFVMISTDKAVNPTNIMGATKRICEMIIQTYNNRSKTEYVAVRFGNVLGSNGSVIPLFKKQIEAGGPVTVTHPDIIRYFMTIPEAVSLVLQAGAYAKGGEIFVLDMGEPVKIVDLARNLILLSGHKPDEDIQIVFTGLRPGEKLYEEMLMKEEGMQETANKLIHIGKPIQMDEEKFLKQLEEIKEHVVEEPDDIREWVQRMVPTYSIQNR